MRSFAGTRHTAVYQLFNLQFCLPLLSHVVRTDINTQLIKGVFVQADLVHSDLYFVVKPLSAVSPHCSGDIFLHTRLPAVFPVFITLNHNTISLLQKTFTIVKLHCLTKKCAPKHTVYYSEGIQWNAHGAYVR